MSAAFEFVAPFQSGWILEHLAEAVIKACPLEIRRIAHNKGQTAAAVDAVLASESLGAIFAHHIPFCEARRLRPGRSASDVLFFGHYYEGFDQPPIEQLAPLLADAARIWTNAALWDRWLVGLGVDPARIRRIVRAVDIELFRLRDPADRQSRPTIGLVSQHHPRKNPGFVLDAVRRWPSCDWVLLGRDWERASGDLLGRLSSLPNFKHVDSRSIPFESWPQVYRSFDVFVTPSFCEGGPFPLLEAMASGVWPVASRTGFAEDMIVHGSTGHLFDADDHSTFDAVLPEALDRARMFSAGKALRESVAPFTWRRFAEEAAADLLDVWKEREGGGHLASPSPSS